MSLKDTLAKMQYCVDGKTADGLQITGVVETLDEIPAFAVGDEITVYARGGRVAARKKAGESRLTVL